MSRALNGDDSMLGFLRQELERITREENVSKHPRLVRSLRARAPHTIRIAQADQSLSRFTCAVYAFDLTEDTHYQQIASYGTGQTFAGRDFVEFLLSAQRLEKNQMGNLAIYFENGAFRHIAKVIGQDRLISKWGTGQLWEHSLWEVPESYGSRLEFYRIPEGRTGIDLFLDYAKHQGWELV